MFTLDAFNMCDCYFDLNYIEMIKNQIWLWISREQHYVMERWEAANSLQMGELMYTEK